MPVIVPIARAVRKGVPLLEGVTGIGEGVGGEVLCHAVGELLVDHVARGVLVVLVEMHPISVGRHIDGVTLMTSRAMGYDNLGLWRAAVAACPTGEAVPRRNNRVDESDVKALAAVGCRVGQTARQRIAAQCVADVINRSSGLVVEDLADNS